MLIQNESKDIPVYIIRLYGKWESWRDICDKCGRFEYNIIEEQIEYVTIRKYRGNFVKVNKKSKLSIKDYWEVERVLRGFKNEQRDVFIENI